MKNPSRFVSIGVGTAIAAVLVLPGLSLAAGDVPAVLAAGGAPAVATAAALPRDAPPGMSLPAPPPERVLEQPVVLDALGVELVSVGLSASDFLVDLRYRVLDAGKAQALLERRVIPVLVNESTGDRYYIPQTPKVGPLRQSATSKQPAQPGKIYFMLFANPDRKLRAGEKVTLHAGDAVIKDLVVRR